MDILNMHALAMTHMDAVALSILESDPLRKMELGMKTARDMRDVATIRETGRMSFGVPADKVSKKWAETYAPLVDVK